MLVCLRQMALSVVCWHVFSNRAEDDVWRREERIAEHIAVQTDDRQGWEMIKNEGIINNEQLLQGNNPSTQVCLWAIKV